jgi:hypothetical protein
VSHGTRLELLRPDVQTGKLASVVATDVFGSIRSLVTFRLTGGTKGTRIYTVFTRACAQADVRVRLCHCGLGLGPHRHPRLRPQGRSLRQAAPGDVRQIRRAPEKLPTIACVAAVGAWSVKLYKCMVAG